MGAVAPIRNAPSREFLEKIFRTAFKIRVFETEGIKLYRQGLIRGYFHPYLGQEGIATGACAALKEGDYIASTHRGHGHCIAWGADVNMMVAELLQKETGYCRGYGGSMHIADIAAGNLGANGIVGAGTPLGVGAALANQVRGSDAVTLTFSTDGASNNGTFLESLNLAAIWNLNSSCLSRTTSMPCLPGSRSRPARRTFTSVVWQLASKAIRSTGMIRLPSIRWSRTRSKPAARARGRS